LLVSCLPCYPLQLDANPRVLQECALQVQHRASAVGARSDFRCCCSCCCCLVLELDEQARFALAVGALGGGLGDEGGCATQEIGKGR